MHYNEKVKEIFNLIFEDADPKINIKIWDGTIIKMTDSPKFTLIFNSKKAFKRFFFKNDAFNIGKAYIDKDIDVEGDIYEAIKFADSLSNIKIPFLKKIFILLKVVFL
ncbi:MAG: hypothetical protein QW625_02480 [Candidatus Nanoarchaeia archaeon]